MKFKVIFQAPPISEVAKEMIVEAHESDELTIDEAVQSVNHMQRVINGPLIAADDIISIVATR